MSMRRFNFFLIILISFAFLFQFCQPDLPGSFNYQSAKKLEKEAWERLPGILERINPPDFADPQSEVTVFGENGDSTKDFREAFNKAIIELSGSGGGRLIVPPGQYFIDGPIHLKSNINLHIEEGARIFFSSNPDSYLPAVKVRWEGTVCYNYSPPDLWISTGKCGHYREGYH